MEKVGLLYLLLVIDFATWAITGYKHLHPQLSAKIRCHNLFDVCAYALYEAIFHIIIFAFTKKSSFWNLRNWGEEGCPWKLNKQRFYHVFNFKYTSLVDMFTHAFLFGLITRYISMLCLPNMQTFLLLKFGWTCFVFHEYIFYFPCFNCIVRGTVEVGWNDIPPLFWSDFLYYWNRRN